MRDMFDAILKVRTVTPCDTSDDVSCAQYGAYIVDELRKYRQVVTVVASRVCSYDRVCVLASPCSCTYHHTASYVAARGPCSTQLSTLNR
jgi:hypothetical protein